MRTMMMTIAVQLLLALTVAGRGLSMLPLSADHVYRLLHAAGQGDALPEGRVVTQGLAAVAGFTLGLTKALGGIFLYDVITANVTDLEELPGASAAAAPNVATRVEEICFNTRRARSYEEAETIAEYFSRLGDSVDGEDRGRSSRENRRRRIEQSRQNDDGAATTTGIETDTGTGAATGTYTSTTTVTDAGATNCVAIEKRRRRSSD